MCRQKWRDNAPVRPPDVPLPLAAHRCTPLPPRRRMGTAATGWAGKLQHMREAVGASDVSQGRTKWQISVSIVWATVLPEQQQAASARRGAPPQIYTIHRRPSSSTFPSRSPIAIHRSPSYRASWWLFSATFVRPFRLV